MQQINLSGLEQMNSRIESLLRDNRSMRKELHQSIGVEVEKVVQQELDHAVGGSSEVKTWQKHYEGSQGGYTAVRPEKGKEGRPNLETHYAKGQITNALESGHVTRPPSEGYVQGYHFYFEARRQAESRAIQAAEAFVDTIAGAVEG